MLLEIKCEACGEKDLKETNVNTLFYCQTCDDEIHINECNIEVVKDVELIKTSLKAHLKQCYQHIDLDNRLHCYTEEERTKLENKIKSIEELIDTM